jgi:hypothetical protein
MRLPARPDHPDEAACVADETELASHAGDKFAPMLREQGAGAVLFVPIEEAEDEAFTPPDFPAAALASFGT